MHRLGAALEVDAQAAVELLLDARDGGLLIVAKQREAVVARESLGPERAARQREDQLHQLLRGLACGLA